MFCTLPSVVTTSLKPVALEVLRAHLQRIVKENQVFRSLYHSHLALLPGSGGYSAELLPESLRRKEEEETEALRRMEETEALRRMEEAETTGRTKESGVEEWQLQLHHLQEQLQESEENVDASRERICYLQYSVNRLRKTMSTHSIQPPILMEYDYYRLLQRKELDELRSLFGKRLLVMADDERLSSFFCDQAALPLSLLPSLLRNYASLAYPLEASGTQRRSTETKGRTLESPTNPVGEQPPSMFPFSKCCVDEVLSMCAAVPTVLRLDVFEDYWDSFLCGYSPKQRLYRLLGDGGVVTYIHLKRLVCDYLLMHPKTVQVIHEMNPHGNACALDPSGFDNITHPTSFCRFCSVYVITVAAAILFDLTGCISSVVYPRQLNESRLVGVYSSFHLVVHSSPVGSEACFARFPLCAHLFAADLHSF